MDSRANLCLSARKVNDPGGVLRTENLPDILSAMGRNEGETNPSDVSWNRVLQDLHWIKIKHDMMHKKPIDGWFKYDYVWI